MKLYLSTFFILPLLMAAVQGQGNNAGNVDGNDFEENLADSLNSLEMVEEPLITKSERTLVITRLKSSNEQETKRFLKFAAASYCKKEEITSWSCSHCQVLGRVGGTAIFEDAKTESRVVINLDHYSRSVVVSFRGSANLKNWIQNVKILKTPLFNDNDKIQVHFGFKQTVDILSRHYTPVAKVLLNNFPNYSLVVTGHSLGGAVATLATLDLIKSLQLPPERVKLFTYGEPRIGNKEFATWFNTLTFTSVRVVNNMDMVPHLPPRFMFFSHVNSETWIKDGSPISCAITTLEDKKCSLSINKLVSAADHLKYFDVPLGGKCPRY